MNDPVSPEGLRECAICGSYVEEHDGGQAPEYHAQGVEVHRVCLDTMDRHLTAALRDTGPRPDNLCRHREGATVCAMYRGHPTGGFGNEGGHYYVEFDYLAAALRDTGSRPPADDGGPRPDSGIDAAVLAEAMHVWRNHRFDYSEKLHPDDHPLGDDLRDEASGVAREYARLELIE